jgi:hypothetical protein
MSLDGFYRGLAAMTADPDLVRRCRAGDDEWLLTFELSRRERERLRIMAVDDGMEVSCSLYRSNRLAALVRTVPELVEALGPQLRADVTEFWISTPRADMQFRTEGAAFCDFVRARHSDDRHLVEVVAAAETALAERYDRPPSTPRGESARATNGASGRRTHRDRRAKRER